MAWYRTGTVSVTNGSTTVTLTDGNALANIFPGDSFLGPDGRAYEVAFVTSATSFTLATAYQGTTATGQPYAIQPTGSTGALRLLNDQVSDLVTNYQTGRDAWASAPASTLKGRTGGGAGAVENLTPADVLTLLSGGTPGALTGTERLPALQGTSAVGLTVNQLLSRAAGQALPFVIGGQRIVTMTSTGLGVGTASPRAAFDVGGAFAAGREFHNVATFHQGTALAHGFKIKTNINAGSGIMCRLRISGYDYRSVNPIGIDIVFYAYTATSIIASRASSYGNWTPTIQIGHEGGKVVVHLGLSVSDGYHAHFTVDASSQAAHSSPASFRDWTVVDEAYAGEHTVTPTYHNRFGFITIDGGLESHEASLVARRAGDGMVAQFFRGSAPVGSITVTGTTTAYNTTSDYRVKINLEPLTGALDRIDSIPVYRGNFTADPDAPKVDMFLAHEAQAGVPEAVTGEKDAVEEIGDAVGYREHDPETGAPILASKETLTGITQAEAPEGYVWTKTGERPVYQGIDQSKLVPLHHAGIQELRAEIRSLKARLAALEAGA